MKHLITLFYLLYSSHLFAKSCLDEVDYHGFKWAAGQVRSQGGGWNWYLGKGEADDSAIAFDMADSRALSFMVKECQIIPVSAKFIERCIDSIDGKYFAYSRISTEAKYCNKNNAINKVLSKQYDRYQRKLKHDQKRLTDCSKNDVEMCLLEGDDAVSGSDFKLGVKKYKQGCLYNNPMACFKSGKYLYLTIDDISNLPRAEVLKLMSESERFYRRGCDLGMKKQSCIASMTIRRFLSAENAKNNLKISDEYSNSEYENDLKRLCISKDDVSACSAYAYSLHRSGQVEKSLKVFQEGCLSGDYISCYDLTIVFEKPKYEREYKKEYEKYSKYLKAGCHLGHAKSCRELKYLEFKISLTNIKPYLSHLKYYCDKLVNGYNPALESKEFLLESCVMLDDEQRKNTGVPTGIYINRACEYGSKKGCEDLEFINLCIKEKKSKAECAWTKLK